MDTETIVEYAQRTLKTFDEMPFNEIDSLILSCMAYVRLPEQALPSLANDKGILFKEMYLAEDFPHMFYTVYSAPHSQDLLTAMCASPRFRNIQVKGYQQKSDAKNSMQFAAVCFQLNENLAYIAYRGTDATVVGWKEDFNMAFQYPVPSQEMASQYLEEVSCYLKGNLIVGGHSKGGNLAVYASMNVPETIQERIVSIYSLDGPGFPNEILNSKTFEKIAPKVQKILPQSSVIGMLLEHQEDFTIIKSNRFSVWQHDPYSWEVDNDHFIEISHLTPGASYLNRTINAWLVQITPEERERFISSLYRILAKNNAKTAKEFKSQIPRYLPYYIQAASELDEDTKHFLKNTLKEMAALSLKNIYPKHE